MANLEAYKNSKWVEGKSGNKNGRPLKEFSITTALKDILSETNPSTKIECYKELLQKALQMAMRGDGDMLKYLINRIEGMPKGSETNLAVQVNNYQFSKEEVLSEAYELVSKDTGKTIEQLKS